MSESKAKRYVKLVQVKLMRGHSSPEGPSCPGCGHSPLTADPSAAAYNSSQHIFRCEDDRCWCPKCDTSYTFGELADAIEQLPQEKQDKVPPPGYGRRSD